MSNGFGAARRPSAAIALRDTRSVPWDPAQYLKFADQRLRPAVELLARVDRDDVTEVYDLGCGAGNVTRLLRDRWPRAHVTGVDSSAEMLQRAARDLPDIEWIAADLATWRPSRSADLIFSNAALHWLDHHERIFPMLFGTLRSGGVLAVQMPRNFAAPQQTLIGEAAGAGPWRSRLEALLRAAPVGDPTFYYDLLAASAVRLDIWETEYLHVLQGVDPVMEWTKGSALRPLLSALGPSERSVFEAAYAALLRKAYPRQADGTTLFPFRRLFVVAERAA